jgi:hypothetical protein
VLRNYAIQPHFVIRPLWMCGRCNGNWPCAEARDQLLTAYQATPWALSEHAIFLMDQARKELQLVDPRSGQPRRLPWETLYRRFVSWTWPADGWPPPTLSTRMLLSWLVNPSNLRGQALIRQYGTLGALCQLGIGEVADMDSPLQSAHGMQKCRASTPSTVTVHLSTKESYR